MEKAIIIKSFAEPTLGIPPQTYLRNSIYTLVSKIAYLIGVPKRIFENEYEPPKIEIYQQLDKLIAARIVRNLCRLRTAIEQNFKAINESMFLDYKNLYTLSLTY